MRILIVDDVPSMQQFIGQVLKSLPGVSISGFAKNGWEARIEITKNRPDCVLLDEVLPGESAQDLVEFFNLESIPVILLTGMTEPNHEIPATALGRLIKPDCRSGEAEQKRFQARFMDLLKHIRVDG